MVFIGWVFCYLVSVSFLDFQSGLTVCFTDLFGWCVQKECLLVLEGGGWGGQGEMICCSAGATLTIGS